LGSESREGLRATSRKQGIATAISNQQVVIGMVFLAWSLLLGHCKRVSPDDLLVEGDF